jgi:hypothetical protein
MRNMAQRPCEAWLSVHAEHGSAMTRCARQPFASGGARHFTRAPAAARGPRTMRARRRYRPGGTKGSLASCPQPRPAENTAAGAERLPAFAIGRRPFGARAPSIFAPSGPAREAAQPCATVIPGKRGVHAEHGFAMTPSADPGPSGGCPPRSRIAYADAPASGMTG